MLELIGYHGTTNNKAKIILKDKKFVPGPDNDNKDFLGKGVYFFDDVVEAWDWNIKRFKEKNKDRICQHSDMKKYSVLKAHINVEKENILDLTERSNIIKYQRLKILLNDHLRKSNKTLIKQGDSDGKIINTLYDANMLDYDVLKKEFQMNTKQSMVNRITHIMFCVKKPELITKITNCSMVERKKFEELVYFH